MTGSLPSHGGQLRAIARSFGAEEGALLDFSASINPDGPPPQAWEVMRQCLQDPSVLTSYPDLEETELRESIGRAVGVRAQEVAVANGFGPLLAAALRVRSVRRCLLPVPCFGEYRRALEEAGVAVTTCGLREEVDFRYELDQMRARIADGREDAVLLANPQNPSGVLCKGEEMLDFVRWADARGVTVFLDEAFIDYAPEASLTGRIVDLERVMVFRSVTKFYAVPGARVGYVVSNAGSSERIRSLLMPWAVSTVASRIVAAIVDDQGFGERTRADNERRRDALAAAMEPLGVKSYPGAANFVLLRLPGRRGAEMVWARMIREHGVVLRDGSSFEGLGTGFLRSAIRLSGENTRMVRALASSLGDVPEGVEGGCGWFGR